VGGGRRDRLLGCGGMDHIRHLQCDQLEVVQVMIRWIVVWALCAFVGYAAQWATIRRVHAANAVALEGVRLMVPVPWRWWVIILPPVTPVAMLAWLIKLGVLLWGTISLEVDPELRARFFAHLGGSPPPDN